MIKGAVDFLYSFKSKTTLTDIYFCNPSKTATNDNFVEAYSSFPTILQNYNPSGKKGFYDTIYPSAIYKNDGLSDEFKKIIKYLFVA